MKDTERHCEWVYEHELISLFEVLPEDVLEGLKKFVVSKGHLQVEFFINQIEHYASIIILDTESNAKVVEIVLNSYEWLSLYEKGENASISIGPPRDFAEFTASGAYIATELILTLRPFISVSFAEWNRY